MTSELDSESPAMLRKNIFKRASCKLLVVDQQERAGPAIFSENVSEFFSENLNKFRKFSENSENSENFRKFRKFQKIQEIS